MSIDGAQPLPEPAVWRFGDFELDDLTRVVRRAGAPISLSLRAYAVLRHLVRHHHRAVPRAELLAQCWPKREVTEGAVARIMLSLRTALGDADPQHGVVRTVPRVGYRLGLPARVIAASPPCSPARPGLSTGAGPASAKAAVSDPPERLAVLPVDNRSTDPAWAWVELGLASLLSEQLAQRGVDGLSSLRQVLVAWSALPRSVRVDAGRCADAVAQACGAQAVLVTRLGQEQGSCVLHLELHGPGGVQRRGAVVADGPAESAPLAARVVAGWLDPGGDAGGSARPVEDLGDAFLDEASRRAQRHLDEGDLLAAEHLLEMLRDAGADAPGLALLQTRTALLLGRPRAAQALWRLEERAARLADARLQVEVLLLKALGCEQRGQPVSSVSLSQEAVVLATRTGLHVERWRASVACAGASIDARTAGARAMLAQAMVSVEGSGDRLLLRDACVAAGHAAAAEGDWVGALRHHGLGRAIAQTLHCSAGAAPLAGLAQARLQLGQLDEARVLGEQALRRARLGGAQPVQGTAALALTSVLQARRCPDEMRALLSQLDAMPDDRSAAMEVARESRCRAAVLSAAGRHDEALACIAGARQSSRAHPVLAALCVQDRLQVLLAARRLDEVQSLCAPLIAARGPCLDARLAPWLELAMACCEHALQADPGIALRRLDSLLARTPPSQVHALAGLAAAWIELDAGRVARAAAQLSALHPWTVQCPVGRRVAARLELTTDAAPDACAAGPDLVGLLWQPA